VPDLADRLHDGASSLLWVADGVGRNTKSIASTTTQVGMASEQLMLARFQDWDASTGGFQGGG